MSRVKGLLLKLLIVVPASAVAETWDDWYHVEFIVFSQISPSVSDENWALKELSYPDNMIVVEAPGPMLIEQLEGLQRYEAVFTDAGTVSDEPGEVDFLFEDRSRFNAREQMEAQLRAMQLREQQRKEELLRDQQTPDPAAPVPELALEESVDIRPEPETAESEQLDLSALLEADSATSFQPVASDERILNGIARSLTRSSRYRMLRHTAWRQPIREGESWPILVQTGEQFGDQFEVDGTLTVRRARFLHADADLWYTQFAEDEYAPAAALPQNIDPARARDFPELLAASQNQSRYIPVHTHRLGSSRRMRRSELHYLDHPYFGVIIQIERYTGPESALP